ncbi:MAG TPA: hypothetical protein VGS07_34120 [Thermoanaerobaculia bacterium]|jgi:hypothetical protein|nr:hypothetical protein [Thermoanaerobaculia bacterium]
MKALRSLGVGFFAGVLIALFNPLAISAQTGTGAPALRDGQHDFDFEMGSWKTHLSRLEKPLTGSTKWIEFDGTIESRPIWGGKANLDEFEADGPNGHIQGLTLRLYNPESHQWSLYWGTSKNGTLPPPPTVGSFNAKNGQGEFYDQESFNGRMIFVRYVWSNITPTTARFVQSFSDDGGKTWEDNWISTMERVQK